MTTVALLPNGRQQFFNGDGKPLVGGTVTTYIPGGFTPKTTYSDFGGTVPNTNPITLDALGSAAIWGPGYYRQIVNDSQGNLIWDIVTLAPSTATGAGTVTSVDVSGGTTGLSTSGGPITTSGTITLGGTLALANGGTGAITSAAALTNLGATTVGGDVFTANAAINARQAMDLYIGSVTSSGAPTFLPTGWSSSRGSAGVYNIHHGLGTSNISVVATAGSNSGGVGVQRAFTSGTNDVTIATAAFASGALTDTPFTFIIVVN